MFNDGNNNYKKRRAPATQEDIMDLEKDIHSIKTLHGYTKQEHAQTIDRLNNTEAKLNAAADLVNGIQERLIVYAKQDHAAVLQKLCETEAKLVETTDKLKAVERRLQNLEADMVLIKRAVLHVLDV
jgi:chromosome segregation ATPase